MKLRIELISDTTFGRGDGVVGLIDSEVEYDAMTGTPFVKGRTVKGLLVEACADILFALNLQKSQMTQTYIQSAQKLFGQPGSTSEDTGCLHIGQAQLAEDLRMRILRSGFTPAQILDSLTTIRHQTAVDPSTDRPTDGSLRAMRVVLRQTTFYSDIVSNVDLHIDDKALIAACANGLRRAGQSRTRGRGRLKVTLETEKNYLKQFVTSIGE